jgi:transcriptional regulator with XRE-family HTH domain
VADDASLAQGLGLAVRRTRSAAGLSQEALADRAGLDRAYVSGLERGHRNPTLETLQRLAAALGVNVQDLLRDAEGLR